MKHINYIISNYSANELNIYLYHINISDTVPLRNKVITNNAVGGKLNTEILT